MRNAPDTKLYDLFKLSVAVILLILLILVLLQRPTPPVSQPPTQAPVSTRTSAATTTQPQPVSTETPEPVPTQVELPPFPDSPEPLRFNPETQALETSERLPIYRLDEEKGDWVPLIPDELSSALGADATLQSLTDGWVLETQDGEAAYLWDPESLSWKEVVSETVEAETKPSSEVEVACPLAKPSRLEAGTKGRVISPLNIRSSPGILANNRLFTMPPGTELKIIGNPICLPHYKGAYLWWQVEIPGVQVGWSAEAPQNEDFYFIDPIE